jgi:hypothetical protein
VQEEAIYRCINPACARLMPRPVKFCPWCGTAQAGASAEERAREPAELDPATRRAVEAQAAASAAAELSGWSDAPLTPVPSAPEAGDGAGVPLGRDAGGGTAAARAGLAGVRADAGAGTGADALAGAPEAPSPGPVRGGWLGTAFGHGAGAREAAAPADSVPRPPIPPRPAKPGRAPIRLRWWLLVLLVLWIVWLQAGPNSSRKIEQRIAHASALAGECKAKEAQDELIALRNTRATPAQLQRLQDSLNEGAAACTRKRQKDKAWNEASAAAESALSEGNPERAHARLQAYTRRYGDDARARALRQRIDDARHPLAAPDA